MSFHPPERRSMLATDSVDGGPTALQPGTLVIRRVTAEERWRYPPPSSAPFKRSRRR